MVSGRCGPARRRRSGRPLPAAELTRKLAADALAILERPSVEAPTMEIVAVPAFSDNYLWLVHDEASGETAVVDPGDAGAGARRGGAARLDDRPDLEHALAPAITPAAISRSRRRPARASRDRRTRISPAATSALSGRRRGPPRQPRRPGDRSAGPHARPYRADLRRGARRLRRRHLVRDGLRPAVRGHARADVPLASAAGRAARRDPALLRARIYAGQRALRRSRRAGQ